MSYNDFVFKDGQLIGRFDDMYRQSSVVPWEQDKRSFEWYADLCLGVLNSHKPYGQLLDIGCGLGYFTHRLGACSEKQTGWDISESAVESAKALFPNIEFEARDISQPLNIEMQYDIICARELLWYVLPNLDIVFSNFKKLLKPNGYLFTALSFPSLDKSFYGKEKIPNPRALWNLFEGWTPIVTCTFQKHEYSNDGPNALALFQCKN